MADHLTTCGHLRALETRESRSGLAGVLVSTVMDGAGVAHLQHAPIVLQTGAVRIVGALVHPPVSGYPGDPDKPELQLKWFIDQALAIQAKHPELAKDPNR